VDWGIFQLFKGNIFVKRKKVDIENKSFFTSLPFNARIISGASPLPCSFQFISQKRSIPADSES